MPESVGAARYGQNNPNLRYLDMLYDNLIKPKDSFFALGLSNQFPELKKQGLYCAVVRSLLSRGELTTSPDVLKLIVERQEMVRTAYLSVHSYLRELSWRADCWA